LAGLSGMSEDDLGDMPSPDPSRKREGRKIRARQDGFTPARRRRFIKTLAKTGCIKDGCRVAKISRTTVERWRDKDAEFARTYAIALHQAESHIETLAWERAVTGIEEPVIHYGKQVGTRIKRSDSIFRLLLIGSNRKKYGRMGAVGRKQIEKELRPQIEREVKARIDASQPSIEEVRASIRRKLDAIDEHKLGQGYSRGPEGLLIPPGWKMVRDEAAGPEGEDGGTGGDD
jgi:hypothetical protein